MANKRNFLALVAVGAVGAYGLWALLFRKSKSLVGKQRLLAYVGRVERLIVYPVKSCCGIETDEAVFSLTGLTLPLNPVVKDRHFIVVFKSKNEPGEFHQTLTQRMCPRMAFIKLAIVANEKASSTDNTVTLRFLAPDMPNFDIVLPIVDQNRRVIETQLWKEKVRGYDCGPEAAAWFRKFLGRDDLFLVHSDADSHLKTVRSYPGMPNLVGERLDKNEKAAYVDFSPGLLINSSSIDELNRKIKAAGDTDGVPITYKNFRPTVLFKSPVPFEEDDYDRIYIGPASLCENATSKNTESERFWLSNEESQHVADNAPVIMRLVRHCTRCVLTTVDPILGEKRADQEPLKTLRKFRLSKDYPGTSPLFGVDVALDRIGRLHTGDAVFVSYMSDGK